MSASSSKSEFCRAPHWWSKASDRCPVCGLDMSKYRVPRWVKWRLIKRCAERGGLDSQVRTPTTALGWLGAALSGSFVSPHTAARGPE